MALPTDPTQTREEVLARRRAVEEDALLREVDNAVRQDDMLDYSKRYGLMLAIVAGVLVLGFGGYLFWESRREAAREAQSETLVAALDQVQASNLAAAEKAVQPLLADGASGPSASAHLLAAGAATIQNQSGKAASLLTALAADASAPAATRDLARLRLVALQFDTMDKAQAVAQLAPLAQPGSPWFGSAGELLAMAYLEQGKRAEAGRLFADIARANNVPEGIRSRARQMAGVLGVDAIPDVGEFLKQQRSNQQASDAAPGVPGVAQGGAQGAQAAPAVLPQPAA